MYVRGIRIDRKRVIIAIVLVIAVIFMFNLLRVNRSSKVKDSVVEKNISMISARDFGKVEDVEEEIEAAGGSGGTGTVKSGIATSKYRGIFDNCVVVGDSITEGLVSYDFLDEGQVVHKVGASIRNDETMFSTASAAHPKAAFFSFGMNDMGNYNGDEEAFVDRYRELLKGFSKASPKTEIYVNSISTPSASARKDNRSLKNYKKFNSVIRKMCSEEGYPYIDNNYILEEHPEYYAKDGIHVSPDYYEKWLGNMIIKAGL